MVSTTGARLKKDAHPHLPLTEEEICRASVTCWEAGASAIHLHVRDNHGSHTLDPSKVRSVTAAIRSELGNDAVIQMTTESAGIFSADQQMSAVHAARPEAISVAVREITRAPSKEVRAFFHWLCEESVATQFLLYDLGDFAKLIDLVEDGTLPTRKPNVLFGIGSYNPPILGKTGDLAKIVEAVGNARANDIHTDWMVCCFGRNEAAVTETATQLGGHIRIGFENNTQRPDGTEAIDNAELIRRAACTCAKTGIGLLTASDIRSRWAWH